AGGAEGLIDGIKGTTNWRKGDWQGYQNEDFEAVVDLQQKKPITLIEASFLQDSRSWILMPVKVEYYVSNNNRDFTLVKTIETKTDARQDNVIENYTAQFNNVSARYVKVKAYNFGTLPQWHQGAGGQAFIFIDEITIN